jgi:hypothetical protein
MVMRRISFVGAMVAVAIGAVLAFAVTGTPKDLDLQTAGLCIMLGGIVDLVVRFAIADSPLLSRQSAEVAAVVEPVGDPVLDASGNPVYAPSAANLADRPRPPLVAPAPGTLPGVPRTVVYDQPDGGSGQVTVPVQPGEQAVVPPMGYQGSSVVGSDYLLDTPEAPQAIRTITGRRVRPRGRRSGRS